MGEAIQASRRCDGCGGGIRTADAHFGERGDLLCDGCAARERARAADAVHAAALQRGGDGLDGWQLLRLALIGLKLVLLVGYLATR